MVRKTASLPQKSSCGVNQQIIMINRVKLFLNSGKSIIIILIIATTWLLRIVFITMSWGSLGRATTCVYSNVLGKSRYSNKLCL